MSKPFTVDVLNDIESKLSALLLMKPELATPEYIRQYMVDSLNEIALQWHTEQTRWIPVSERLPTKEDADENGRVEFWVQEHGDANMFTKTLHYLSHKFAKGITHWRKIVKPDN